MNYSQQIVVKWFAEHGIIVDPEYQFAPPRKWRFDFVIHSHRLAIEVDGGVWTQGRHTRGSGFAKDMEKLNRAACLGYRVIRVQPDDLCMQETVDMIKGAMDV